MATISASAFQTPLPLFHPPDRPPFFPPAEAIGDVQPEDDDEDRYPQTEEEEEAAQTFADQTDRADGRHEEIGQDEAEDGQDVEAKIQ